MSKASTWARKTSRLMRFRERLTPYERRRRMIPLVASVLPNGKLSLDPENRQRLSPQQALRLARWILDTFGEGR